MRLAPFLRCVFAASVLSAGLQMQAQAQETLRTNITSDLRGLSPGISADENTGTVLQQIYEGLVAWRTDGSVAPMLARDIKISDQGKTYRFTLRDGVRFHNGAPLTAQDVVWTWRWFLDPKNNWPCRSSFDGSGGPKIESVTAESEREVRFTLREPNASLLSTMARADCDASGIAHPSSVDASGAWVRAVGTGPFRLTEWKRGEYVELARFDGYQSRSEPSDGYAGAKKPMVERIRFMLVPDPMSAKLALQSGQIDLLMTIDPKYAAELKQDPKLVVRRSSAVSINALAMQTRDPLLSDPRIRRAINLALDRQALVDAVYDGFAEPNASPVPLGSRYRGAVQKQGLTYDLAGARRLLAEAGYKGQPIKLITNNRFPVMHDVAIVAQAMLKAAGLNVQVEVLEFATAFDRYLRGNYQMTVINYTPYLDPVFGLARFIGAKNLQADKVWDDPQALALVQRLMVTPDPAERQPYFDQLHRRFVEDAPMAIWSSGICLSAWNANVKGYAPWPGRKSRLWNVSVTR